MLCFPFSLLPQPAAFFPSVNASGREKKDEGLREEKFLSWPCFVSDGVTVTGERKLHGRKRDTFQWENENGNSLSVEMTPADCNF